MSGRNTARPASAARSGGSQVRISRQAAARFTAIESAQSRGSICATGVSFGDLAAKHGVSHTAIIKRAKAEGWTDGTDVADVIRRKVSEKVSGAVSETNPRKRAEAIDAAAEAGADIIRRHRRAWSKVNVLRREAFAARNDDLKEATARARLAKTLAEATAIQQAGERKAYGLEKEQPQGGAPQAPVIYLPANGR